MSDWNGELTGELWEVGNNEYHDDRTADSSSTLKVARKSLELYRAKYVEQSISPVGSSPEMVFGSAFHCALLEPDHFAMRYAYEPDNIDGEPINRRLKAHREYLAEWADAAGGKDVLQHADRARIEGMLKSVEGHPLAMDLMESGQAEAGVKFTMGNDHTGAEGHQLKALFDWVCFDRGIIMDVKTTRHSGSADVFSKEIDNREYHCQAALYCEAYRQLKGFYPEFYWLFVHTEAPYESYVFKMGQATRDIGLEVQAETIELLKMANGLSHWHAPDHGAIKEIEVPMWTLRKYNKENEVAGF